jgi:hypothetical protein
LSHRTSTEARVAPSRREWLAVGGMALVVMGALIAAARPDQGLEGDEADYVLRALDFRAGMAPVGTRWGDYRAPGLPYLMSLVPGGSVFGMRLVPIAFCGAGIVITWLLARALFGPRVALIAAALLALTPGWLIWSWWIFSDVPGAVLGLASATVVVYATAGDRIRWWAFTAVPLAVAATYVRYGAPMVVAIALFCVLGYRWSLVKRHLLTAAALAGTTLVAMAAILVVPGLTGSTVAPAKAIQSTGSEFPYERFQSGTDYGHQLPEMVGVDRARELGTTGAGALLAQVAFALGTVVVLVVAAGWALAVVRAARGEQRGAVGWVLLLIGGSLAVLVVTLNHGETRYLTPIVPWIVVGAAFGLSHLTPRLPRWSWAPAWLVLAVPAALFVAELTPKAEHSYGPYRDMGARIAADHPQCVLVANVSRPSVAAPSGCVMLNLSKRGDGSADLDAARPLLDAVPRDQQVWLLNLEDVNLFPGERAATVDLGALQSSFGLREIPTGTEATTGLRLFYAS